MNKLIAAVVVAVAFAALPALASPVSATANGQPTLTSGRSAGTLVAQNTDQQSDSNAPAPSDSNAPSQDSDSDK
jgi:hypothetical protein